LKYIFAFSILLNPNYLIANDSENTIYLNSCSGQIMNIVQSQFKNNGGKDFVFSKKIDDELIRIYHNISNDLETKNVELLKADYKSLNALTLKNAPDELKLCIDWMNSLSIETKNVCPELSTKSSSFAVEFEKCSKIASENKIVKSKLKLWKDSTFSLVFHKK
jgi:hypothetical protein